AGALLPRLFWLARVSNSPNAAILGDPRPRAARRSRARDDARRRRRGRARRSLGDARRRRPNRDRGLERTARPGKGERRPAPGPDSPARDPRACARPLDDPPPTDRRLALEPG